MTVLSLIEGRGEPNETLQISSFPVPRRPVALFADMEGVTPLANPLRADANGDFVAFGTCGPAFLATPTESGLRPIVIGSGFNNSKRLGEDGKGIDLRASDLTLASLIVDYQGTVEALAALATRTGALETAAGDTDAAARLAALESAVEALTAQNAAQAADIAALTDRTDALEVHTGIRETFAGAVVAADYADPVWVPNGFTKTVTDGWLIAPPNRVRVDTAVADSLPAIPADGTVITVAVDVRVTAGETTGGATIRLNNVTTGQNATPNVSATTGAVTPSTEDSSGSIDLNGDGSVWRFWAKIAASAGDRIQVDLPSTPEPTLDFANPAVFYADLAEADIGALA